MEIALELSVRDLGANPDFQSYVRFFFITRSYWLV